MESNLEHFLSAYYTKPGSQSRHSAADRRMDKENVEQEARMPSLEAGGKVSPMLATNRRRKKSDTSFDRPPRHRGLQEVDNTNHFSQRRRIHSSTEASDQAPAFSRARFFIYREATSGTDLESERKPTSATSKSGRSRFPALLDSGRGDSLRRSREGIIGSSGTSRSRRSSEQLRNSARSSNQPTSPAGLPGIPKPDVFKIKEEHRRASLMKKKPKQATDVLPLELAYNVDYMSEYVRFQMEMYDKNQLSPNFPSRGISANQRRLVVKYLIGSATYHRYPSFILYQAVKIFDYYIDTVDVRLTELQIAALASLWIALKKDLIADETPEASTIINLAAPVFNNNRRPLIEYERKILIALNFEISYPDPFSMLSLYTIMIEAVRNLASSKIEDVYYCGSYLIDLSLLIEEICHFSAVYLAVISAEIALVVIMSNDEQLKNPEWSHWRKEILSSNPLLERNKLPELQMNCIRNNLLQKVILSKDRKTDYHVVYKKYSIKRYGPVSSLLIEKISALYMQKITNPLYDFRPILF